MREKIIFIYFLFLFGAGFCKNGTEPEMTEDHQFHKSKHSMATYWKLHSLLSPIGVGFNSFVLYLFVIERKNLIKSVNVMMW